ncbi:hypothetical protein [Streptomyces sp. PR69]|uniref:hypothetical protein n=1 Tax=Streptomyces sp. PR69 TaxID=2984950 RepID=UPI0022644824|nr:hypothetical protein [Streptomyces sp. PR69]
MRISSRLLTVGLAGSALAGSALLLTGVASASDAEANGTAKAAAEQPPFAVEDFAYPGADRILKEKNLKLKHGNGKIVLAECDSEPNLLRVIARDRSDFCFKVTGDDGYLSLEVPSVGGVQSNDYNAKINMTVGDEHKSFDIPKNSWKGVGENADPAGREHTLVEIITTK